MRHSLWNHILYIEHVKLDLFLTSFCRTVSMCSLVKQEHSAADVAIWVSIGITSEPTRCGVLYVQVKLSAVGSLSRLKASKWVVRCLIEWDIRVSPHTAVHSSLPVSNLQLSFTLSLPTHRLNMTSSLPLSLFSLALFTCVYVCWLTPSQLTLWREITVTRHGHHFYDIISLQIWHSLDSDITTVPGLQLLVQL